MSQTVSTDNTLQSLNLALEEIGVSFPLNASANGSQWVPGAGLPLQVSSPINGSTIADLTCCSTDELDIAVEKAHSAFKSWRTVPAPQRGQLVRIMGQQLRQFKKELATIVTIECGKIFQEGLGEVQEMIDICDFAVGQSRQLYGLSIASERAQHRLSEQWHPLGPVGVISAFNFPVAVWAWNAMLAVVCGDPVIWKPSEKTPLCAIACHQIALNSIDVYRREYGDIDDNLFQLVTGGRDIGAALSAHNRVPLISATGSTAMGRKVAQVVGARLGKSLLELGGNNAAIITPTADLELAIRGIVFSAVGTCGQRCTSLRRLIVHQSKIDIVRDRILKAYSTLPIGNPLDESRLVGPLIDEQAYNTMQAALDSAREQGGTVHGGTRVDAGLPEGINSNSAYYVNPALVEIDASAGIVHQETFAPITYLLKYETLEEAIEIQNSVSQGLASAIFTGNIREAELFCSPAGSDCGIANVNIGTSGAEIGGAFGGEKDTGGGRESGSDAWKNYMRRATNTINYSSDLPLAQGISFEI